MEHQTSLIKGVIASAIFTIIFIMAITIIVELVPPIKDWLKSTFTHHWIGKGVLATGLFTLIAVLGSFYAKKEDWDEVAQYLNWLTVTTILGGGAILLFFIWEALFRK